MSALSPTSIAFIGLGHMGLPMAKNLATAGFTVAVFDVSETACTAATKAGLTVAASAKDAAKAASTVISMLPAGEHVEALYLGDKGLLQEMQPGSLVIDCSTIAATSAQLVATAAATRKLSCLDAPVSGGTSGAAAGTLTFMVGGSAADVELARPILSKMGANILHAGPAGAGQTAKVCNNMLLAVLMIGTSEALNLGVASGLDPKVVAEIMRRSSGGNWALEKYNPYPGVMAGTPADRDYTGGFGTALMLKDLRLAQQHAAKMKVATPLGTAATKLYAEHAAAGFDTKDFSSIIRTLQNTPAPGAAKKGDA